MKDGIKNFTVEAGDSTSNFAFDKILRRGPADNSNYISQPIPTTTFNPRTDAHFIYYKDYLGVVK